MEYDVFWDKVAKETLHWMQPWTHVRLGDFNTEKIQWFVGGKLNVSVNCLDRHLAEKAKQIAIFWEGDDPSESVQLTFKELHQQVCQMANVLKKLGLKKGDVVGICMPMIPESLVAMLAATRIGAVHMVVFAGFSAQSLRERLIDSKAKLVITADGYQRGGKAISLKAKVDEALVDLGLKTLVIQVSKEPIAWNKQCDFWWHELQGEASLVCEPELMDAEDPLFILYTSGSTGKPKGLVHTTGGYLVQVAYSFQKVFACKKEDVFWCTADIGWITGHSYLVYGPLSQGISTLIFAGIPTYPTAARFWEVIDKYKVQVFYTAPTAIRSLRQAGDKWLETSSRQSLRLLGSVGEPINPEVWRWYYEVVGQSRCPIVDTWWQTETGAIMISPQSPFSRQQKPGAASTPLPGIDPVLLDDKEKELKGASEGLLAIQKPWPALARTILHDHKRYLKTYFHNGYYLTGDGASRDKEGDYWIKGRIDDVVNVSGHRLGIAEIESALVAHKAVAEAAVVSVLDEIKGEAIYAFVTLKQGEKADQILEKALIEQVKKAIGSIAKPDTIRFVDDLPKTRSGKIMRRILRKIARKSVQNLEELGDISTLANPKAVEVLMG